jgi:hypothetical protein
MKKDTRNFILTMVSIPAILVAASGVHAFAVPDVEQQVAEVIEVPLEAPSVATTTLTAEPAKKPAALTPVVKKATTPVATVPVKTVVVTPAPVVTKPKLTPVKTVVVTPKRSRTTRAS